MDTKRRKLMTLNKMYHPKADMNIMYVPRREAERGMINLKMTFKTTSIGLNSYLERSHDWMLYVVLQYEKKNQKESRKFKFQLHIALEEHEPNKTATKAATEIKKKAKQAYQEDLKKTWTETAEWKKSTKD